MLSPIQHMASSWVKSFKQKPSRKEKPWFSTQTWGLARFFSVHTILFPGLKKATTSSVPLVAYFAFVFHNCSQAINLLSRSIPRIAPGPKQRKSLNCISMFLVAKAKGFMLEVSVESTITTAQSKTSKFLPFVISGIMGLSSSRAHGQSKKPFSFSLPPIFARTVSPTWQLPMRVREKGTKPPSLSSRSQQS